MEIKLNTFKYTNIKLAIKKAELLEKANSYRKTASSKKHLLKSFLNCIKKNGSIFTIKKILKKLLFAEQYDFYAYNDLWTKANELDTKSERIKSIEEFVIKFDLIDLKKCDYTIKNINEFDEKTPKINSKWVGIWLDTFDKGGLEEVVATIALGLIKRGMEIRILCNLSVGLLANKLMENGVIVKCFFGNKTELEEYLGTETPVLLNTHYTHNYLDVAKKNNIPVIEVLHSTYLLPKKKLIYEKKRSKYFNEFIAVSKLVKDYYKKTININNKILINVIENAVDIGKIQLLDILSIKKAINIPPDEFVFLSMGSYNKNKNQLGLIYSFYKAIERGLKNCTLILCGNITEQKYFDAILGFIAKYNLGNGIKVFNYNTDVGMFYSISDTLIINSYIEGWSIAATEALYCGLGLIHTDCGSAQELCYNKYSKVISNPYKDIFKKPLTKKYFDAQLHKDTNNTDELVSAFFEFYEMREEIKENRHKIAVEAQNKFSLDKMVQGYIDVFSKYL